MSYHYRFRLYLSNIYMCLKVCKHKGFEGYCEFSFYLECICTLVMNRQNFNKIEDCDKFRDKIVWDCINMYHI